MATRLLSDQPLEVDALGGGDAAFLCRVAQKETIADLVAELDAHYTTCQRIADAALSEETPHE